MVDRKKKRFSRKFKNFREQSKQMAVKTNEEIKQKDTFSSAVNHKNDLSKIVAGIKEITSPPQVPITDKSMELVNDSETDDVEIVEVNISPIQIDPFLNDKSDVMETIDITNDEVVVPPLNISLSPSNNLLATSKNSSSTISKNSSSATGKISSSATRRKSVARSTLRLKWDEKGTYCSLCDVWLTDYSQFKSHVCSMMHKMKRKINEPIKCVNCNRRLESIDHQCKPATKKAGSKSAASNVNTNNNIGNPSTDNEKIGVVDVAEITLVPDVNKRTPLKISCKNNEDNSNDGVTINTDDADGSKIDGLVVGKIETPLACNVVTIKKLPAITISACQNSSNSNNSNTNKNKNNNNNNSNTDKNKNNNNNNINSDKNKNNNNNNNRSNNVGSTSSGVNDAGVVNAVVEKKSLVTSTCLSCNMLMPLASSISQEHNCKVRSLLPATKNSDINCNKMHGSDTNNSSVVYSKKPDNTVKEKKDVNKTAKQNNKPKRIRCKICNKYYSESRFNDHMARFHSNRTNADHVASPSNGNHYDFGSNSNSMYSPGNASPHQLALKNIHPNNSSVNVIKDGSRGCLVHNDRPSVNNRNNSNGIHVGEIDSEQWENGPPFQCRSCKELFSSRSDFCNHGCGQIKTFKTTAKGHSENTKRTSLINWKRNRQNKNYQSSLKKKRKYNFFGNKNRLAKAKSKEHNAMHFASINHSSANSQSSLYSSNAESEFSSQNSLGTVPPNAITVNNRRPFKPAMKKTSGRLRSVIKFCQNCDQRLLSSENVRLHQEYCNRFEIVARSDKLFTRKCPDCSFISSSFKGLLKHYRSCFPMQQPVSNKRITKNDDGVLNLSRKHTTRNEHEINSKRPSDIINSTKLGQDVRNKSLPRASPQSKLFQPNETQSVTVSKVYSLRDPNVTYDDGILSPFNFLTHKN